MPRSALATAVLLTLIPATSANAADLPSAPPLPPSYAPREVPPAYSWTGIYTGANVGFGWADMPTTTTFPRGTSVATGRLKGVIGGGQLGYNWQTGNWLLGLETDFQGSGQRATIATAAGGITIRESESIPWFGTVRGRLGFSPVERSLLYLTGGLAYGSAHVSGTVNSAGLGAGSFRASSTRTGWTLGGGLETALYDRWTMKLEYLYVDLGNVALNTAVAGVPITTRTRIHDNIVRVGLNYRY